MSNVYAATSLTGGAAGALDLIDGTGLADKDSAIVFVQGGGIYFYVLDADSGAAESSPSVISPDANAGTKRWILHDALTSSGGGYLKLAGGTMTGAIAMGSQKVTGLGAPSTNGDAVRATTKITEANLESAVDLKHAAVTISGTSPLSLSTQALSLKNDAAAAITAVDTDKSLAANSDTEVPSEAAVRGFVTALDNSKAMSQAVSLTAASSGSTGIKVEDSDHIDFGTGNFSLVWRGSLPDWTPASDVKFIYKVTTLGGGVTYDGFRFDYQVSGKLALYLYRADGGTPFLSTVASGLADGTTHEICISVVRETASVAGSITFYVDGVILGASVAIPAAATASISNTASLYFAGWHSARAASTSQFFATFNRALSAADALSLYQNGIAYADKWGSQTDLLSGWAFTSGWTASNITINDANTFTITGTGGQIYKPTFVTIGKRYRCRIAGTAAGTVTNMWVRTSTTHKSGLIGTFDETFEFVADGTNLVIGSAGTGQVDIAAFVLLEIGATMALEPEGIDLAKWRDSSTNLCHASYPTAGASLVRLPVLSPYIDVRSYGAVPNNVSFADSNVTAFNAAFAASAYKTVYIPPGTWFVSSGLTWDVNGSRILGGGYENTSICCTDKDQYIITVGNGSTQRYSLSIGNITLSTSNTTASTTKAALYLNYVAFINIHDLCVYGGISGVAKTYDGIYVKDSFYVTIDRCYVTTVVHDGIVLIGHAGRPSQVIVNDTVIEMPGNNGSTWRSYGLGWYTNVTIQTPGAVGIYIDDLDASGVDQGDGGIFNCAIDQPGTGHIFINHFHHIKVIGCQLDSAATPTYGVMFGANCSQFIYSNNIMIITNTTPGNTTTAVSCLGTVGVVTGNTINGSGTIGGYGIYLAASTVGVCVGNVTYLIPGTAVNDASSGGWEVAHNVDA